MKKPSAILIIVVLGLISSGCSTYLARVNGTDGQLFPATALNIALLEVVNSDHLNIGIPERVLSDLILIPDLVPSVATDTALLPIALFWKTEPVKNGGTK